MYRIQKRLLLGSERVEYNEDIFNECLIQLDNILRSYSNGKSLSDFNLPAPRHEENHHISNEYLKETSYNVEELSKYLLENESRLNQEQKFVLDTIWSAICVENRKSNMYILDAAGGTGLWKYYYF